MMDPDLVTLLLVPLIYLVGGLVKGVLGFGLPIVTMSLLPFVVSIEQAIVLSALVQPFTNIFQLVSAGGYKRAFNLAAPVILTLIPGVLIGAWLLSSLDKGAILLLVGLTISLYALYDLSGAKLTFPARLQTRFGMGFGLLAGFVGAITTINGWAFIMYLIGAGVGRQEFRAAIALLFIVSGALISASFVALDLLTVDLLLIGLAMLVPSFFGMWIGDRIAQSLPATIFRRLLLIALVLVGCVLGYRGTGLLLSGVG